jgi:hypothetical protein
LQLSQRQVEVEEKLTDPLFSGLIPSSARE